jgi:sialic acid synthase SpsE
MDFIERIKNQGYYIISEMGVNYYDISKQQNISLLDAAKLMIDEAVAAGTDAVKFQTYKAGTLAAKNSPSYWDTNEEPTTSQYELFQKFDKFGAEEYSELAEYCRKLGTDFLSTPFDYESADYLEPMMPIYKISSSDITNIPFIKHMATKRKPIFISTGASNMDEIKTAIQTLKDCGVKDIGVLHCILEYPTPYNHANLDMITTLKENFPELLLGYSDHTKPDSNMDVLKTAWLLGAEIIEKHFTLDKTLKGNDHYHAMDPADLRKLKQGLEFVRLIRGDNQKKCLESEMTARKNARRSIVSNTFIKAGTVVSSDMLTFKRPGTGISPADIDSLIGKMALVDIKEDTVLQYEMFGNKIEVEG